jgi:hypothetical protein
LIRRDHRHQQRRPAGTKSLRRLGRASEREVLQWQNQKLRTARDLLLPRLMSGELAV